jgi:hypothetical protein
MIEEFVGQTIVKIDVQDTEIHWTMSNGVLYTMYHEQDCCESVWVEDVCGDIDNLTFTPILKAYEDSSHSETDDYESETWTFYNIATIKGSVTIRWCGTSNGYYSESVDWKKTPPSKDFKTNLFQEDLFTL